MYNVCVRTALRMEENYLAHKDIYCCCAVSKFNGNENPDKFPSLLRNVLNEIVNFFFSSLNSSSKCYFAR